MREIHTTDYDGMRQRRARHPYPCNSAGRLMWTEWGAVWNVTELFECACVMDVHDDACGFGWMLEIQRVISRERWCCASVDVIYLGLLNHQHRRSRMS